MQLKSLASTAVIRAGPRHKHTEGSGMSRMTGLYINLPVYFFLHVIYDVVVDEVVENEIF